MVRAALILAALALAGAVLAQAPTRVRGTISAFDGKAVSVKDAGGKSFDILLVDKTEIVFAQPIALGEIKSGDFLGVTSTRGRHADGLRSTALPQAAQPGPPAVRRTR
jgi:hypothetical protein